MCCLFVVVPGAYHDENEHQFAEYGILHWLWK